MSADINTFAPAKRAVIALCGPIAQAAYLDRELPLEEGDAQIVAHSLAADRRLSRDVIVARANAIVTTNWAMITRSAQALLNARSGRLSYAQLVAINTQLEDRVWRVLRFA